MPYTGSCKLLGQLPSGRFDPIQSQMQNLAKELATSTGRRSGCRGLSIRGHGFPILVAEYIQTSRIYSIIRTRKHVGPH